jgi:chromosome segregation protein
MSESGNILQETVPIDPAAGPGAPAVDPEPAPAPIEEAGPKLLLQRMKISGFKSFSDGVEVRFPEGITAIVGPNGCGKSNIGDAVNWVLGEQSPKLLRGSKMMDVIFNGSAGRKPLGLAEVSIHLRAANGISPDGEREFVITRRLFRSGESDYLINGKRARLKDIQELLRRAHIGAKTYATIEQGRIDSLLNAKPRDRRQIIEDAAGISGFKHKRRLAELKLEATHANLLRVNDILTEVRRQINSLKRQAAKARRYQRLRDELREKERIRFGRRARDLDLRLAELGKTEADVRETEAETAARLGRIEAEVSAERQSLDEADRAFRETSRAFHKVEAEVDRKEERIELCRERIDEARASSTRLAEEVETLKKRLEVLAGEIRDHDQAVAARVGESEDCATRLATKRAELGEANGLVERSRAEVDALRRGLFETMNRAADVRNRRRGLEEALERSAGQRARLEQERATVVQEIGRLDERRSMLEIDLADRRRETDGLQDEHERSATALAEARERLAAKVETLSAGREGEQSARARLGTLEDVATRFAGVSDGVRALLTDGAESGLRTRGVVADFVQAGREIEAAAEVYLQGLLPAVVLEDDDEAMRAAELLRAGKAGRTSLVSRSHPAGAPAVGAAPNGGPPVPETLLSDPRVRGRLRDHLDLDTRANGFIEDRIGEALVVDTLDTALAFHRDYPQVDYLTPGGDVVYASGIVAVGGSEATDHGLLAHNRKIQEARATLDDATARTAALQVGVAAARADIAAREERLGEGGRKLEAARGHRVDLEMQLQRVADDHERSTRRVEILDAELVAAGEEAASLEREATEAAREVDEAEQAHRVAEERLHERAGELELRETELRGLGEEGAVLGAELAMLRQRQEDAERQSLRLHEARIELERRLEASREEGEAALRRAEEAGETLKRTQSDLVGDLETREHHTTEVSRQERALVERRTALAENEEVVRTVRSELEIQRQQTGAAELARARAEADRQHLDDLCEQELGTTASEAADAAGEALADADIDALETEVGEIRSKIERIGPVNIMAIDEFSDLEERQTFLSEQKTDLERSMESLRETIRRINRTSRDRFATAFEVIRSNYQEIFKVLFKGGRADLRLEEGEDILECGIEILAQPPGKRLSSVQLLSGGEKAMAAIAILFAVFRYQPSPFCLLDEVDAALDDVNVGRFTRMLREYASETQFIIVTHNKLSMESADLIYGVTMEEPGVSKLVSLQLE